MERYTICDLQNKRLIIRYHNERHVKEVIGEFIMYLLFVVLETLVCLSLRHRYMFYMNKLISDQFFARSYYLETNVESNLASVFTDKDIIDFIEFNFLKGLHGQVADEVKPPSDNATNITTTTEMNFDLETMLPPEIEPKPPHVSQIRKRRNYYDDFDDNDTISEEFEFDDMEEPALEEPPMGELRAETFSYIPPPFQTGNGSLLQNKRFLFFNELLGAPRVRQIRVQSVECWYQKPKLHFNQSCHPKFASHLEDTTPYYKGTKYFTIDQLESSWIFATLNFYTGGGYVEQLSLNYSENVVLVRRLRDVDWVDDGTRVLLVEFNTYSRSTPLITQVQFIFEVPACGTILTSQKVKTVIIESFVSTKSIPLKALVFVYYCFILYYTIRECRAVMKYKWRYILYLVNWLDTIIIVFAFVFLFYNFYKLILIRDIENKIGTEEFISVDRLTFWQVLYIDACAIHLILVYMKVFHYINFTLTIAQFTLTLKWGMKELLCVVFLIILFALTYSVAGILLFGDYHKYFVRFTLSLLALMRFILFDFQYKKIHKINVYMAPVFFLTFLIFVYFVILQLVLVVIMTTYNNILSDEHLVREPKLISYVLKHLRRFLKFFTKRLQFIKRFIDRVHDKIFKTFHVGEIKEPTTVIVTELKPMGPTLLSPNEVVPTLFSQFVAPDVYQSTTKKIRNLHLVRIKNRIALLDECVAPLSFQMEEICRRFVRYLRMYEEERRLRHEANEEDSDEDPRVTERRQRQRQKANAAHRSMRHQVHQGGHQSKPQSKPQSKRES